jgi:hypothetical protein
MQEVKKLETFLGRIKEKLRRLSGKIEQHQQAVTFAELGEHDHAQELLQVQKVEEKKRGKLLVVGREASFSRELIDYALKMAERSRMRWWH